MSINYQFGDVDAHGALIRAQAAFLEAEHQAIIRDVLAAGDFWGGAGSVACQEFITQLGRNFQVIYEQANAHGQSPNCRGQHGLHRQRRWVQLGLTSTQRRQPHLDRKSKEPARRWASRNQLACKMIGAAQPLRVNSQTASGRRRRRGGPDQQGGDRFRGVVEAW